MERVFAYAGSQFVVAYAICSDGGMPGLDFYNGLSPSDKAKVTALFQRLGEHGRIESREKFRKIDDELWEFKSFQIRMPCAYRPGRLVLVTHGFIKKRDATPPTEIQKAKRILQEDSGRS